ncbi:hypothetical protein PENTCL1PPCAC_25989, partial [Pristionchus entomophagus]
RDQSLHLSCLPREIRDHIFSLCHWKDLNGVSRGTRAFVLGSLPPVEEPTDWKELIVVECISLLKWLLSTRLFTPISFLIHHANTSFRHSYLRLMRNGQCCHLEIKNEIRSPVEEMEEEKEPTDRIIIHKTAIPSPISRSPQDLHYIPGRNVVYEGMQMEDNHSFPSYLILPMVRRPRFKAIPLHEELEKGSIDTLRLHVDRATPPLLPQLLSHHTKQIVVRVYGPTSVDFAKHLNEWEVETRRRGISVTVVQRNASLMRELVGERYEHL